MCSFRGRKGSPLFVGDGDDKISVFCCWCCCKKNFQTVIDAWKIRHNFDFRWFWHFPSQLLLCNSMQCYLNMAFFQIWMPLLICWYAQLWLAEANMNLYFFLILFPLSSLDAGKNSFLVGVSGNQGEKSNPHQEKAEGGIHYMVTLWFKCSSLENRHLLAFTLPSLSALLRTPFTHIPGLLSEICQNTFHTNRYFSAFKAGFDLLDKPKQLKFCEISKASQPFSPLYQTLLNTPLLVLQMTWAKLIKACMLPAILWSGNC